MIRILLPLSFVLLAACAGASSPSPAPVEPPTPPHDASGSGSGLLAHQSLNLACERDSDCAVKNIGNCCGTYLACVNADSPTDPAAVARECADKDLAGICGFPDISACACVHGRCEIADTGGSPAEELE